MKHRALFIFQTHREHVGVHWSPSWALRTTTRAGRSCQATPQHVPGSPQAIHHRGLSDPWLWVKLQGAELMSSYGVNVPPGIPVFKLDEVLPAAQKMADEEGKVWALIVLKHGAPPSANVPCSTCKHGLCGAGVQVVLKSQILAGGRGLGKFKNGLQGGVHICSVEEAPKLAEQMLGQV